MEGQHYVAAWAFGPTPPDGYDAARAAVGGNHRLSRLTALNSTGKQCGGAISGLTHAGFCLAAFVSARVSRLGRFRAPLNKGMKRPASVRAKPVGSLTSRIRLPNVIQRVLSTKLLLFRARIKNKSFKGGFRMADKQRDPEIVAVQEVFRALKPLDDESRKRVLLSVFPLLQIKNLSPTDPIGTGDRLEPDRSASSPLRAQSTRRLSLIELVQQKQPGTNPQRIALFAYYREKYEGLQRFARDDLSPYFGKAKISPSGNYARDFTEAVRKGWIHEDGTDSYLTSKGVEAVESGFEGERKYASRPGPKSRRPRAIKRGTRGRPKAK
jgi:hypothetical protein